MSQQRRTGDGGVSPVSDAPRQQGKRHKETGIGIPVSAPHTVFEPERRKATLKGDFPQFTTIHRVDQFTGEVEDVGFRQRNPLDEKFRSQRGDPMEGSEDP